MAHGLTIDRVQSLFTRQDARDLLIAVSAAILVIFAGVYLSVGDYWNNLELTRRYIRLDELIPALLGLLLGLSVPMTWFAYRRWQQSTQDLAALQQTEAQLLHAQKMEAIGELTGGIAHDFNNLLMIVGGYAQRALASKHDPVKTERHLKEIILATQKASTLTTQLLGFSRREATNKRVTRLSESLDDMKNLLATSAGELNSLILDVADKDACVNVDPSEFSQAILNLVINARDAMPKGGEIAISTETFEPEAAFFAQHPGLSHGRYARVCVRDEGVGMDKETRNNAFLPFFTTKPQGKGTGLGLSMVYGFTQRSLGTISVDSAPGAGTTITMFLPVVDKTPDNSATAIDTEYRGSGETILLVEDDRQLLQLTRESLEDLGYRVLVAADGFEALEVEQKHADEIDLLLTDAVMPNMGGFELAEIVRKVHPHIQIIVISGYTGKRTGQVAGVLEHATFVRKPVDLKELAKIIRTKIDSRKPVAVRQAGE